MDKNSRHIQGDGNVQIEKPKFKAKSKGGNIYQVIGDVGLDEQGVSAMLDDKQRQLLDNARLNLGKAVSEENIESKKVLSCCAEIKNFLPGDFMANFYEVACGGTAKQLNKFLNDINIEKDGNRVNEIADFLLKGMEYSSVLPLKNLVDISLSGNIKVDYLTAIEKEAEKIKAGVYSTQIPRDVFVAYSSKDYKKVNEIVGYLEDNKITCFVALRNLRHGKGAVENYVEALKEAMHNCKCVVFFSSNNSRSLECDALKQEIPYIRDREPDMGRIEYLLEDYDESTNDAAKRICESFFKNLEYCRCKDDLLERVLAYITGFDSPKTDSEKTREKMKYCLACGAENPQRSKFCIECGAKDFADYQGYLSAKNEKYLSERRAELEEEYAQKYKKQQEELQKEFGNRQKELDELKKQNAEETEKQRKELEKQREVLIKQTEELKIKSAQQKPAYPTLENYDKTEFEIEDGTLKMYKDDKANVIIPDGVTSIGVLAFRGCTNLTSITIPDSVTSIGSGAFQYCTSLTSITIPDSVTSIGDFAFQYCTSLTSITIPDSVTSIGSGAFQYCTSLTSVTIPNGVIEIDYWAFQGCTSLESITMPFVGNGSYITHFGYIFGASEYQKNRTCVPVSLKTVVITGDTSIDSNAFNGCKNIENITIPNSVTSIGYGAFEDCESLTSITIPDGVTEIGDYAFRGCTSLTSITIPDSVTSIGSGAFQYCTNLTSITVEEGNTNYSSQDDILYNKDKTELIKVPQAKTNITIPNSVTSIGDRAFYGCTNLTNITIPNSVTSIGNWAFSGCTSLTSITIPNDITSIGNWAFDGCTSLTSITIPNSVTSIGDGAFYGCTNLTNITIPNSVTSIGDFAFEDCGSLTSITVAEGNTTYSSQDGILYNKNKTELIRVPQTKTSVTIPESVTSIGSYAFSDCTAEIQWGDSPSIKEIGKFAFSVYKGINITIPNSVTSIGYFAFEDCGSLTSITIPDGVTEIGGDAFEECENLTIYCEAEKQPETWKDNWNANCPVVWGYNKK